MHSSRMRTGRALTVSGGVVHPRRNFGGKNLKKKNLETPKKLETPEKFGDPPKNLEDPPEKLQTPPKNWSPPKKNLETPRDQTPPCGQTDACKNITLAQLRCGR